MEIDFLQSLPGKKTNQEKGMLLLMKIELNHGV